MIRIWGRQSSVNVQKVLWTCDELGVPFERIDAGGLFSDLQTASFRALNPNARVPVLEDSGFVLWESNAIVRYVAATFGAGQLCPLDPRARADAERWMDWQLTDILPSMRTLFFQLVRARDDEKDPAATERALAAAATSWRLLDEHLRGRRFVTGDDLSIADIPLGTFVYRWMALPVERPPLPSLMAWFERLCGSPHYARNVMRPLE
ncbi:glutathione S-transferase family protein [Falsiroseomonas oryzae]|uniref:glutathione S-transferase family protein n=1 Tax=Falsiroseomonas oryzae TaxID=2766473 RepID=UPI0022EA66D7|nr:glutathione S-transferase family protein [Roseomonas sp. MO-31]